MRNDLGYAVREYGGNTVYVIEDKLKSRFYRIGLAEYTFVSLLDGKRTFSDALGWTASISKADALNETEATALCRWLVETGLATTPEAVSSERLLEGMKNSSKARLKQFSNPLFIKVPLFHPDRLMQTGANILGWAFQFPAILFWMAIVAWGTFCVLIRWADSAQMTSVIVSENNWIYLIATTLVLKVVHEAGHGIACRTYGGNVREAGVMTILFVPLPYVDVTSVWRLESRWQRMMVSAAGMYVELLIAAVAAIIWYHVEPGLLRQQAFNVMFSASVVTVVFNINPLMRFDGYYILTDLLSLPNLAPHGQLLLKSIGRRVMYGLPGQTGDWPEGRTPFVFLYGVGAIAWRVVISVGLVLAADAMFMGAGIVLAMLAIAFWLVIPTLKAIYFGVCGSVTESPNRAQFAIALLSLACVATGIANVKWRREIAAPFVVDYDPQVEIRPGASGFLRNIYVASGDNVQQGDLLFELENRELTVTHLGLTDKLSASRQQARKYHHDGQIAAWQVETETAAAITERLAQVREKLDSLRIMASVDGVVLTRDLNSLQGTWVSLGSSIATLGQQNSRTVLAMVSKNHAAEFRNHPDRIVDVYVDGNGGSKLSGTVQETNPAASTAIPHPALASTAGGRMDVRQTTGTSDDSTQTVFAEPQFLTRVQLPASDINRLQAGRTGTVRFQSPQQTVADATLRNLTDWWHKRRLVLREAWDIY